MADEQPREWSDLVEDAAIDWVVRRGRGLSPREAQELARWRNLDSSHEAAFAFAERNWCDGVGLRRDQLGIAATLPRAPFYMRQGPRLVAASSAAALIVGLAGMQVMHATAPALLFPSADAQYFATKVGEIKQITLDDRIQVTLDTASKIVVQRPREMRLLAGRARVVVSQLREPLIVSVDQRRISVTNAIFDVAERATGSPITILSGSVRKSPDGESDQVPIEPTAYDTAAVGGSIPSQLGDWTTGMLAPDSAPLGEVVAALNRYNTMQVRLADDKLAQLRVTGAFRANDPRAFAQVVAQLYHLKVAATSPNIIALSLPR